MMPVTEGETIYVKPVGRKVLVEWHDTPNGPAHFGTSVNKGVGDEPFDSVGIHCPYPYANIVIGVYDEARTLVERMLR